MPRKPGPGRNEYNNEWNRRNPVAAKEHRRKANVKHMGEIGSPKREIYNLRQAANRRMLRLRRKKAAEVAAKLLARAKERAQNLIYGYTGSLKPNHF
jgi:hypothetical protein